MDELSIKNVGWTLGNDCPYRCSQCYSNIVRTRGRNLEMADADRIICQLHTLGVKAVNLGGNEPIFTSGPDPRKTMLPYIIRCLHEANIAVGLTTAGVTLVCLERVAPDVILLLNDVDISLDSPFPDEHNRNRGAALFNVALKAVEISREHGIGRTIVMCGMRWNLSDKHIDGLIGLAKRHGALFRINFMKPTERKHMDLVPNPSAFYGACRKLFSSCKVVEMGEPLCSAMVGRTSEGCPCGTKSLRIHSITPEGLVPVSPCVYAHDYKVGDLLKDDLADLVARPQFEAFGKRRRNPGSIEECRGCEYLDQCKGGCVSRAYLWAKHSGRQVSFGAVRDPYCFKDCAEKGAFSPPKMTGEGIILVHRDYLCTLIFDPS